MSQETPEGSNEGRVCSKRTYLSLWALKPPECVARDVARAVLEQDAKEIIDALIEDIMCKAQAAQNVSVHWRVCVTPVDDDGNAVG